MDIDSLKKIAENNAFDIDWGKPVVWVFRNTKPNGDSYQYVKNTGKNNTDTVFLVNAGGTGIQTCRGRSLPHAKYQRRAIKRNGQGANRIATSFIKNAWKEGHHRNYPALRQNEKFLVWRSGNSVFHDEEDFDEYGIQYDNCHGWAPYSAGCITVRGQMYKTGGGSSDWEKLYIWAYRTHEKYEYVDAVILNHLDIFPEKDRLRLRYGSEGERVKKVQENIHRIGITVKTDGIFGVRTHNAVQAFQAKAGVSDDGIVGPRTLRSIDDYLGWCVDW